jgi:proteasome lid subunit RPN8/RPN11
VVVIKKELIDLLVDALLKCYPYEGCGFLLGKRNQNGLEIFRIYPVENVWSNLEERKRRFAIDPRDYLKAERTSAELGLEILGLYHSHPDYPATPSSFDADYAWEGYVYLIFSIAKDGVRDYRAYIWVNGEGFKEVEIKMNP